MADLDKLIDQVKEGEEPEEVIQQTLLDMQENAPHDPGGIGIDDTPDVDSAGVFASRPFWGLDNVIRLRDPSETMKALALLKKAGMRIKFINHGGGAISFEVNSQRDSAAQMLSAKGIKIKSVA